MVTKEAEGEKKLLERQRWCVKERKFAREGSRGLLVCYKRSSICVLVQQEISPRTAHQQNDVVKEECNELVKPFSVMKKKYCNQILQVQ